MRPAFLTPNYVMYECCGRTHATALFVLNAQNQSAVGAAIPEVVIAEAVPQASTGADTSNIAQHSSWFSPPYLPEYS